MKNSLYAAKVIEMTPLVSVIIPTKNRPLYLPNSVQSALDGMDQGDVEVVVVPNGPDNSWRRSLLPYRNNPLVRVLPIEEANANIARKRKTRIFFMKSPPFILVY